MLVYRVAHETKTRPVAGEQVPAGPYNGLSYEERGPELMGMSYAHSRPGSEKHHPAPWECPVLGDVFEREVCGFPSLDALMDWFAEWYRALTDAGFVVWVYDVPEELVRVGTLDQAVFEIAGAEFVESFPIPLADQQLALF